MASGSRCFHASGVIGSTRGPIFLVEYAQTFFSIFAIYFTDDNQPNGTFRLGMPHILTLKFLYILFKISVVATKNLPLFFTN